MLIRNFDGPHCTTSPSALREPALHLQHEDCGLLQCKAMRSIGSGQIFRKTGRSNVPLKRRLTAADNITNAVRMSCHTY
jgi:hypothetical protein